jgi:hypothetical protein
MRGDLRRPALAKGWRPGGDHHRDGVPDALPFGIASLDGKCFAISAGDTNRPT